MKKMNKINSLGCVAIASLLLLGLSVDLQAITIDGQFDPSEGYTSGYSFSMTAVTRETKDAPAESIELTGGQVWSALAPNGDIFLYVAFPKTFVDNVYGPDNKNENGWGKDIALSGKNHNFDDLIESDKGRFAFTNGNGETVLDIYLDYVEEMPDGSYGIPGEESEDTTALEGSFDTIVEYSTSMVHNMDTYGDSPLLDVTENSPDTTEDYDTNTDFPEWIYEMAFEMRIDGSAFGPSGFGEATILEGHASPNKIGENASSEITIGDPLPGGDDGGALVPEPMTLATGMMSIGAIGLYLKRRKQDDATE